MTGQTGQTGQGADLPAHTHTIPRHYHAFNYDMTHNHGMAHTHTVTFPTHSHGFEVPAHTHTVQTHTHSVNIPDHTHGFSLPDHTHEIEQGIFEFGSPTGATVWVNGTQKASMNGEAELDLTALLLDADGNLPRGSWLTVEIKPNDLAYITIDLLVQGFVQSRGGGSY